MRSRPNEFSDRRRIGKVRGSKRAHSIESVSLLQATIYCRMHCNSVLLDEKRKTVQEAFKIGIVTTIPSQNVQRRDSSSTSDTRVDSLTSIIKVLILSRVLQVSKAEYLGCPDRGIDWIEVEPDKLRRFFSYHATTVRQPEQLMPSRELLVCFPTSR